MWETWVHSLGWEDPLEKKMAPTPVFLPGESHGRRSLVGYSPWGCKESDMTERLHFHPVWASASPYTCWACSFSGLADTFPWNWSFYLSQLLTISRWFYSFISWRFSPKFLLHETFSGHPKTSKCVGFCGHPLMFSVTLPYRIFSPSASISI